MDVVMQTLAEAVHEWSAGCDAVRVKVLPLRLLRRNFEAWK